MKLTPLAHQADAHEDGAWSVAWTTASDGSELLLTGSVDETVKSWRASDAGGLELVHSYAGALARARADLIARLPRAASPSRRVRLPSPSPRRVVRDLAIDRSTAARSFIARPRGAGAPD